MSSHHIVREKQEPALLVFGLDHFDDEQLGQLLEWSPTVIATPIIAEQLNSMGIKIDWIITDDTSDDLQSDIKHLPLGGHTGIAAALKHLANNGYPAVNVVTDDFELSDYLPYTAKINLVIFHQQEKIYAVGSGFSKWKPAGQQIRLLWQPEGLIVEGLDKADERTYTTQNDGFFKLDFSEGTLFIAEEL